MGTKSPDILSVFRLGLFAGLLAAATTAGRAQIATSTNHVKDLTEMSLEDLMQVKVMSVSKRPETLAGAAAAIHVVSDEDIRRQGFRTIADALRTVPGMQVAQINSHTWGVSARGFNGEYATKLLVLNDGRSVYTPLFAGVYWDAQDLMLEDLDRIEIIRGPGATLWGANAVNGVINIISKSAKDTQGTLVTGGGGTEERGFGGVRYGGQIGDSAYFRVYAKYDNHDSMALPDGDSANDRWWMARTGFRADWEAANANLFTVQGDVYQGREHWSYTLPVPAFPYTTNILDDELVSGANVLGRWTHSLANDSEFELQTYYDHTEREHNLPKETRDTFDVELQHSFAPFRRHEIVWGGGYRLSADAVRNNYANTLIPEHRTLHLFSAFLQDEITLVENCLRLALGSKFEHNDFTGFEYQPSARLAWTLSERQTVWTAVSRAVRTPSRAEDDVHIHRPVGNPPPAPWVATVLGDRSGVAEELTAYELGYRVLPHPRVSLDAAAFYNVYDGLRSLEMDGPQAPLPSVATFYARNKLAGDTFGAELAADWQILDWWRLHGSYTFFRIFLHPDDGGTDTATVRLLDGNAPRHQFALHSAMDWPKHVQLDAGLRYVDSLSAPHVAAYVTVDAQVSWRPRPDLEFSVVGLNLVQARHAEFAPTVVDTPQREVERSVFGKVTWRF